MPFFPHYLVMWKSYLQFFVYRSSFASFQLVFHENCPTCRCIFDVLVGRGELHVLLLCHLHSISSI